MNYLAITAAVLVLFMLAYFGFSLIAKNACGVS